MKTTNVRRAMLSGVTLLVAGTAWVLACDSMAGTTPPVPRAALTKERISGPYVYENLDVYLVHGPAPLESGAYVPLGRALQEKKVVVRETGTVSQLTIENVSNETVFVQAGEIVKGGKQDRVLGTDLLLPPGSGPVPLPAHCVEQGRWQQRGAEAAHQFESSGASVAHKNLKIANYAGSQHEVWANVSRVQEQLAKNLGGAVRSAESGSSLQLTLENDRVRQGVEGYVRALEGLLSSHPDAIGFAFAVNGELNSADVYGSHELFAGLWPKLLRASATEAVAERKGGAHTPPSLAAVQALLAQGDEGARTEKAPHAGTRTVTRETSSRLVVETHETARRDRFVHRSYVQK